MSETDLNQQQKRKNLSPDRPYFVFSRAASRAPLLQIQSQWYGDCSLISCCLYSFTFSHLISCTKYHRHSKSIDTLNVGCCTGRPRVRPRLVSATTSRTRCAVAVESPPSISRRRLALLVDILPPRLGAVRCDDLKCGEWERLGGHTDKIERVGVHGCEIGQSGEFLGTLTRFVDWKSQVHVSRSIGTPLCQLP